MTVIAIGSAAGTFIESFYGGRDVAYGLVYAAPWFEFALGLFVLNLILSFLKRMPYKPQRYGFAIIHLSMIVILISAGVTRYFGYEGVMPIREGETSDYFFSQKVHARVSFGNQEASFPVPFMKSGSVNHWQTVTFGEEQYELGITDFWAHFTEVYQEGPGGPAGFQYGVSMDGEILNEMITAGERKEIGSVPARFLTSDFSGEMSVSPYGDLRVHSDGETVTIPITMPDGVVHDCGNLKLEIKEFQASYAVGGKSNSSGPMTNPMIKVNIIDGDGQTGERVLFALHPDFSMGHGGGEDPFADLDLLYSVSSGVEFSHNASDGMRGRASFLISAMDLTSDEEFEIAPGEVFTLREQVVYLNENQGFSMVPVKIMNSVVLMPSSSENPNAPKAVRMVIRDSQGNEASAVCIKHQRSQRVSLGGKDMKLTFGPIKVRLPYTLTLADFVLNTYPGSDRPATYESLVLLNDPEKGIVNKEVHIYMNHPLTHRGTKHFQSSYDPDRKGTVLSVNNDPGKLPTYIGYTMITIGFLMSVLKNLLFPRRKKTKAVAAILVGMLAFGATGSAFAQGDDHAGHNHGKTEDVVFTTLSDPARELASRLVIQDFQGRMKPLDTLAREMTMKVAKSTKFQERHPVDMFLNWSANPQYWWDQDVIGIRHGGLKNLLGIDPETKRVSMASMFEDSRYRLSGMVREIHRKPDRERSKVDRKLLTFDERFNLLYMTFEGTTLRMFPVPGDATEASSDIDQRFDSLYSTDGSGNVQLKGSDEKANNTWLDIKDVITRLDAAQADQYSAAYTSLMEGLKTGDNGKIMKGLQGIDAIQHQYGSAVIPSDNKLNAELFYNKSHLFSYMMYPLLGAFVLLMGVFFWNLFHNRMAKISFRNIFYSAGLALYVIGGSGMIFAYVLRWIASGRAPISNGHESLLFISLAAMAAGLICEMVFRISLPASLSALSTVLIIGTSMLSVFDPAIGPLVPVLVSYWLNIHVTIITASYALFFLGFLLGTMILFLIIQRSFVKNNDQRENLTFCLGVLDKINFWVLVVGIGLMTVGTLLGGVWANESWGRYWGWDPKETWSLITILVASIGFHFRYIPKMGNVWVNAWWNWIILDTVLMTYFGVNYFLVGLHSYGAGSAATVPIWVHVFNGVMLVFIVTSGVIFFSGKKVKRSRDRV